MGKKHQIAETFSAAESTSKQYRLESNRREFLVGLTGVAAAAAFTGQKGVSQPTDHVLNLARVAVPSSLAVVSESKISAVNDGFIPESSFDRSHGLYALHGEWQSEGGRSWVQYDWSEPVNINKIDVYWAVDRPKPGALPGSSSLHGMHVPESYRILYWNGNDFVAVKQPEGLGVAADAFNATTFTPVKTSKLRLEVTLQKDQPAGILEWRVYNFGPVPSLPPVIEAGVDRSVVLGARTYLAGKVVWLQNSPGNAARWSKTSGPGTVIFDKATSPVTTAKFSAPGDYVLTLAASGSNDRSHSVSVHVEPEPPRDRLDVVYTRNYSIDSQLWNQRAKTLIVNWIPHCIRMCERTDIPAMRGDGGIDNFIEAGKANRGESHGKHKGYVFSNAWVHQTVESMCIALMVDPQGDPEILQAQELMRTTLERWIPIILAAQMPDGYLQTAYTLADRRAGRSAGRPIIAAITKVTFPAILSSRRSITTLLQTARICASTTQRRSWLIAGSPISVRARKNGSTATRRWSRRWCASVASSTTRKATIAEMHISRSRSSSSIRAAAARSTTRATCRRVSSTRPSATRCAPRTSTRAWQTSPPRRTTRITRAL